MTTRRFSCPRCGAARASTARTCRGCYVAIVTSRQPQSIESARARFERKVDRTGGADACWPWLAFANDGGYGMFRFRGRIVLAPRFALLLAGEDLPVGSLACHRCDNPPCCNPAHLYVGTAGSNLQDAWNRGQKTWTRPANPTWIDEEQVRRIRAMAETMRTADIAREVGLSASQVARIVRRQNWQHVA